jgi:hypothetical protein
MPMIGAARFAWLSITIDLCDWLSAGDRRSLRPRPYDPSVATVLLEIARTETGLNQPTPAAIVLAHDDQPTSTIACQSIARQLANRLVTAAGVGTNSP